MPEFIIESGGTRWDGFKSISLVRSMENAADVLDVSFTSNHSRDIQRALNESIAIKAYLGNELLMTGNGKAKSPQYSATSITVDLSAKSQLQELVECSLAGRQFKGQTFLNMARSLCELFGIKVFVAEGVDANKVLRQPTLDEGQFIWDFLEREARALALRLMSTPKGNLLITNTGTQRSADRLELGKNILTGSIKDDHGNRFSEYVVIGSQGRSNPLLSADNMNLTRGVSQDKNIKRYRPLTIIADDDLDAAACQRRAKWQRNIHFGRSESVTYTLAGWQQSNGKTWQPNTVIEVVDPVAGINGERLITEAALSLDTESGKRTNLTVMPLEGMQLISLPIKQQKIGGLRAE